MDKVPGYEPAVHLLVNFMVNPKGDGEPAESMSAVDALETLGLERARNLAITFFALNYENPKSPTFDWTPLWRHQISVGVVLDFLYDALDLKRSSLEYAAGTFHDIGKIILAEVFPFAFFTAMNRSMQDSIPLADCEMTMFGINHAEIGANWLRDNDFPALLIETVAQHETDPDKIPRRALLTHALISVNHLIKQIGIGFSGDSALDPRPWDDLPSTKIMWEARANRDYAYEDFTRDIIDQFQTFPDLI
jgi:putative nucleotidyltransferase with HDIG domain